MLNLETYQKRDYYIVLILIVLVQLVLGVQGFDVCDDGFVLTSYQQIFNNPESIEYNFVYYLSAVFGGIWYEIFPKGGIIWFRLLTVIVNTLCFVLAFQIFKPFIHKRLALLGLVLVLFVNDYGFLTIYHNHFTVLLLLLSVYFQIKGLQNNKVTYLLISGFFIGLNVFTRIPNLTLFSFGLGMFLWSFLQDKSSVKGFKMFAFYSFGIVASFLSVILFMKLNHHLDIFINALTSLVSIGKTEGSSHNIGSMLRIYVDNYRLLTTYFAELLFIFIAYLLIRKTNVINQNIKKLVYFGMAVLVFLWFKNSDVNVIYVASYIGAAYVLFFEKENNGIRLLSLLGLLMLMVLPLGSGGGISSSGYMCMWLSFPLFLHLLFQLKVEDLRLNLNGKTLQFDLPKHVFKQFAILFVGLFLTAKAYQVSKQAYFDVGSRLKKTYPIHNDLAKFIYTKKNRADVINDLLVNLNKYVKPNDYLLTYDKIPMVHFLTETKPYMYNPWVWIYDNVSFKKNLEKAEKEIKVYPIIVQQKIETIYSFSKPIENYMTSNKDEVTLQYNGYDAKRNKIMTNFIEKNRYKIVWSNQAFNIYKTNKQHE